MTSPVEVAQVPRHKGNEVTELREVLPVRASDVEVFNYTREQGLMLITCNRDDFLSLAAKQFDPCLSFFSFVLIPQQLPLRRTLADVLSRMVAQLFAGIDRNSKAARTLSWDMLETKTPISRETTNALIRGSAIQDGCGKAI
jgi:predicted nuclease of predicted toxin-antitoxin system